MVIFLNEKTLLIEKTSCTKTHFASFTVQKYSVCGCSFCFVWFCFVFPNKNLNNITIRLLTKKLPKIKKKIQHTLQRRHMGQDLEDFGTSLKCTCISPLSSHLGRLLSFCAQEPDPNSIILVPKVPKELHKKQTKIISDIVVSSSLAI